MISEERYFNVPIQLMEGFLADHIKVLNDILYYALYSHSFKLEMGTEVERMEASARYFNVTISNVHTAISSGMALYDSIDQNGVKVGINVNKFWEYHQNHKTEFEKACLLAFLALKSIVQKKSYCKIDNKFLLARMDGKACSCEFQDLSDEVFKFSNEYQTKKIKAALSDTWGLITYSYHTRGFYVSFSMKLDDLVFEAEKRRESFKEKQRQCEIKTARDKAISRLKK